MTWIFSLSAECGDKQSNAEAFAQHFEGLSCALSNGIQAQCQATVFQDIEDNWWCRIQSIGLPEVGVTTPEVAYGMTELGIWLYQRLQSALGFRYALVGVEVDEFRTYRELMDESLVEAFPGLVLADDLWRSMGSPVMFRAFCPGYVWKPYEGEVYKPLMASPALKGKLDELLVLR
jgi:hypothetical protein